MKSIKWKLIAMYLGLVFIVMIASGTFMLLSLQNNETEKAKSELSLYAEKIDEQVVSAYSEDNFQRGLTQFAKTSSQGSSIQGNILNAEGETIASTVSENPSYLEYKSSVIITAMSGAEAFAARAKMTDTYSQNQEMMSYARPFLVGDNVKYIIYTQMDSSAMQESLKQTRNTIAVAVVLALFIAVVMGYIFAKTLTDPISALTQKAKDIAEGNLEQKIDVHSEDEIGQLSETFNYMSAELSKNIAETSKEKNRLEIILHNMTDGVISFHKGGGLMHINSAALDLLGVEEFSLSFTQFIKEYDINSSVYLDPDSDTQKQAVFPVGKKYLKATFSPYFDEKNEIEGLVTVLQDITEEKKLDDMRKEFIANVSHELRTPLTTVKSYTETLMDGALDDRGTAMEFLDIINGETDRMAVLVRGLLQLSHFDNNQVKLSLSRVGLNKFLQNIVRQNKIHAEKKEQTLSFEPYGEEVYITADVDKISQVINNIVTNAIKYSLNKASIRIYITEDENYFKINVKDTGMGIQKEDLPRIFERFYRVDKARSRAMGGSGLGLAIAKEIMEGHNGRITAESEYGKGTVMTMWFLKSFGEDAVSEL